MNGKLAESEALPILDAALAEDPNNVNLVAAHALTLRILDRTTESLRQFERAIELAPYRADIHRDYSSSYATLLPDLRKLDDDWTLAAHLDACWDPRTTGVENQSVRSAIAEQCVTRGVALDALGDTRGAIREFTRASRYYPTIEVNARLGLCYFRMREYRWCERTIFGYSCDEGHYDSKLRANSLWACGWCQLATGNIDAAFHNLRAALVPDPRFHPNPQTQATPSP
jgi:tetratricopeptide (TPR) repeat protein